MTIKDKLAPSTISLARASMTVNEGSGLPRSPGAQRRSEQAGPGRVALTESRRAGAGFPALVQPDRELGCGRGGSKSVKVLIIDDWFVEPTEQFRVSLDRVEGASPAPCSRPGSTSRTTTSPGGPSVATEDDVQYKRGPAGPFLVGKTFVGKTCCRQVGLQKMKKAHRHGGPSSWQGAPNGVSTPARCSVPACHP